MTAVNFDGIDAFQANPLDILEMIASQNEWPYERSDEDEITVALSGQWCDFHIRYFWLAEESILQAAGMLDMRIPDGKMPQILACINLVNEHLPLGHFAIWTEDNSLMFRHSNLVGNLADAADEITAEICEKITETILSQSNRYYPVFQFVLWAGQSPDEAIKSAMLETVGEA